MAEFNWDLLSDDIIHELLYVDMDEENTQQEVPAGNATKPVKCGADQMSVTIPPTRPAEIMKDVDPSITLSEFGQDKIYQIMLEYAGRPESSSVIRHYPTEALHARLYFIEDVPAKKVGARTLASHWAYLAYLLFLVRWSEFEGNNMSYRTTKSKDFKSIPLSLSS